MLQRTILACAVLLLASGCSSSNSCRSARDCAAADRCVNQVCRASSETAGTVGDSCAGDTQCGAGLTCASSGFPNGYCTTTCATATCSAGACTQVSGSPICAATCRSDTDCRTGYGCCAALGNVCLPGNACIPATCERPVAASSLPAPQVLLHEAHHTVGDMVSFNVAPGTASITIVEQAETANLEVVFKGQVVGNSAVPGVILQPSGAKAYDDNAPAFNIPASPDGGTDPSGLYGFFGGDSPTTGAFTLPNTTTSLNAGVAAGTWKFQVNDYAYECSQPNSGCSDGGVPNNVYDVTVLAKPAPAPSATPTVNVNFYIVADMVTGAGVPFNAANAASDPSVQRMLSTLTGIYKNAGITLVAKFLDVSPEARARFGTHINADLTGPCDELDQMFLLAKANPGNTLDLFLVQSITSKNSGGGSVVGIDGTIPGPASFTGTVHSGAAVSAADLFSPSVCSTSVNLGCGADVVAFIAAHEAGHYLGLFHTTEQDGRFFDPLTDTAKCPCTQCAASVDLSKCATGGTAASPVFLKANQCVQPANGCGGGDNLMFWQLQNGASQGNLTSQQSAIMRLSPVVQ